MHCQKCAALNIDRLLDEDDVMCDECITAVSDARKVFGF